MTAERWEADDDGCAVVMLAGTDTFVAVVGDPYADPTPDDLRRLPIIIAAPDLLEAVEALWAPLQAAFADGVKVDPEAMLTALRLANAAINKARPTPARPQMDNPFDGRGVGL